MAFTRRGPCCSETAAGYFEGEGNMLNLFLCCGFVCWLISVRSGGRFLLEGKKKSELIVHKKCHQVCPVFASPLVLRIPSEAVFSQIALFLTLC